MRLTVLLTRVKTSFQSCQLLKIVVDNNTNRENVVTLQRLKARLEKGILCFNFLIFYFICNSYIGGASCLCFIKHKYLLCRGNIRLSHVISIFSPQ